MGWYIVIKTIKGHRYRYRQRTWREGKHVRTESHYLGPADGTAGAPRIVSGAASVVSPTAPHVPEEAIRQLRPWTANVEDKQSRKFFEKYRAAIRREDELIQYGKRSERIKKQKAQYRAARRATKGIKALNPFLAKAIAKTPPKKPK